MKRKSAPMAKWKFRESSRNVHVFDVRLDHVGDEQWFLLQTDAHWDNPMCDREKMVEHLDLAKERNAPVIDAGDFFCAMQGKYDKRSSKKSIRPEHVTDDYLGELRRTAVKWLEPYKNILTVRGVGNHETAILKAHEIDLTSGLVETARDRGFPHICRGGYSGFVRIAINCGGRKFGFKLYYFHGAGGGGPVTRGVIQTNRQAVYLADADIVFTGHTHDAWQMPIARIRLNTSDVIEHCRQVHIKGAGYKEEYRDGMGGFHVERGGAPKPVGAVWLRFYWPRGIAKSGQCKSPEFDVIEAR